MMIFFGISSPAAVILYWFVGGIFSIIQQLITNYIIKPRLKEKVAEEFKKNPPKAPRTTPSKRKDVTPKTVTPVSKIVNKLQSTLGIFQKCFSYRLIQTNLIPNSANKQKRSATEQLFCLTPTSFKY